VNISEYRLIRIREEFKDELPLSEQVLWCGRPGRGKGLTWLDWLSLAVSVACYYFGIVRIYKLFPPFVQPGALVNASRPDELFPILWPLFILSIPIIALVYNMLGPEKRRTRESTYYVVTEDRVMILVNARNKTVRAIRFSDIMDMSIRADATGTGTVVFCPPVCPDWVPRWVSGVVESFKRLPGQDPFADEKAFAFEDIPDAARIYELVSQKRLAQTGSQGR